MKIIQSIKMAVKSIGANKFRSFLTMLGIVIGVASVIMLTGIGGGATKSITDALSTLGTKRITVSITRRNSTRNVSVEDFKEYVNENPDLVTDVSPLITGMGQVKSGNTNFSSTLYGVDTPYEAIQSCELDTGRFISDTDVDNRAYVCLIGSYVRYELFGGMNPVGESIKVNGRQFKIIGVLSETDDSSETSADNQVIIPYTTAQRFLKNKNITTFYLQATSEDTVLTAVDAIEVFLAKKLGSDEGYSVSSIQAMMDTLNEVMGTLTAMLAGIAAISLVVGGIGIMNIMTVSVSERTREIGIRKAIGARTTDILLQFLIESVLLSALGGIIGMFVGMALGNVVGQLMGMTFAVQTNMIVISFAFSVFVGVFFGLAPARKAARLNPIDALRSE